MKKINYIFVSMILLTATSSCKKFLDIKPLDAVSDEQTIFDKASAETALNGTYRQLSASGYYGENFVTLGYFPSGDIVNGTTGGGANLVNVNYRSDDANFSSAWTAIYGTINRANNVISKVTSVQDAKLTEANKNQIIAEAKFIRALAYFDLSRAWGGVQIFLEPTKDLVTFPNVPRSSLEQTHAQILKDLTEAEAALPNTVNRIRATRKTVWALRARFHLYRKEWSLASEYASKLITETANYELIKPFSDWFANNRVGTRESIFELQYSAQNPSTIRAQMQHPNRGGTYRYFPSAKFVTLLKNSGGRRALIDSVRQGTVTQWFGNLYYRNPATDPAYIFRIAEIYLIRAEANAQLNDLSGAVTDLNAVRSRANVSQLQLGTDVNTAEEILIAIENERRVEFAFEAHRWFDLARTGRAKTVLEALDPKTVVDPHELLFPIPITQLQLDPSLTQNPGY